jgi:hypothetical protein
VPAPLIAVAAFCFTTAVHQKRNTKSDHFSNSNGCSFSAQDAPQLFTVGEVDMSQFIRSSLEQIPCVTSVLVKTDSGRVSVDVTVNNFDWKILEPIYEKELDLSYAFREHPLDFRVIDGSAYAREAGDVG